jgi:replicative DNA helicase
MNHAHQPDKPLPHSAEAERALLGAILLNSTGACEEMDHLQPTDFHLPYHQVIFRHMKQLRALGMPTNDFVLLYDAIGFSNELEEVGGAAYSQV